MEKLNKIYTNGELRKLTNTLIEEKANTSDVYTKNEVDNKIDLLITGGTTELNANSTLPSGSIYVMYE